MQKNWWGKVRSRLDSLMVVSEYGGWIMGAIATVVSAVGMLWSYWKTVPLPLAAPLYGLLGLGLFFLFLFWRDKQRHARRPDRLAPIRDRLFHLMRLLPDRSLVPIPSFSMKKENWRVEIVAYLRATMKPGIVEQYEKCFGGKEYESDALAVETFLKGLIESLREEDLR